MVLMKFPGGLLAISLVCLTIIPLNAHPQPVETDATIPYGPANPGWVIAYRFLEEEYHRHNHGMQSHAERAGCLDAAFQAALMIAEDPWASRPFIHADEPFLLLVAQAAAESGGNPRAVSPNGRDMGWGQINVSMLQALKVDDPFDVRENAAGQARHMRALLANLERKWGMTKTHEEIICLGLAAYNASSRAVKDGRLPGNRTTRAYVQRVMRYYERLRSDLYVPRMVQIRLPVG